ncbi:MAG: glycosyltransferase [Actinomycetota bacterium]|nr:glycosyltransferase [Actinomycetota bacterium]
MNLNPIEVQKHLKGINYPASKENLASTAESNNASGDLVEQLRNLPDQQFSGPGDVMEALVSTAEPRLSVVIVTRNRLPELLTTLTHLRALPERPRVVVVDNASSDGTPQTVRRRYPDVEVIPLNENLGAAGRNVGVQAVDTPYVAFSDDDSWWAPGSLCRAADLLEAHPRLGLLAARILIGPEEREDPVCVEMAASPLPTEPDLPGRPVLGFLACASVVRRSAYLDIGGFDSRFIIGGEEELLASDLAAAGWGLAYVDDVTTHHHPSTVRDAHARRRLTIRNDLWFIWLRRPIASALRRTVGLLRTLPRDTVSLVGLIEALRGLPWVLEKRRVVPSHVEQGLRALERRHDSILCPINEVYRRTGESQQP